VSEWVRLITVMTSVRWVIEIAPNPKSDTFWVTLSLQVWPLLLVQAVVIFLQRVWLVKWWATYWMLVILTGFSLNWFLFDGHELKVVGWKWAHRTSIFSMLKKNFIGKRTISLHHNPNMKCKITNEHLLL